ncbi:hypothetical protein [Bacillus sp. JCM 19034]|uniref:hypothetical protein n=1 Tax=Bacillus sp. JCM 19034 TaxID=1481928 RepID=UPI00078206E6|nr:hypothetical protein [Bacillus sp. JCM 19034]
MYQVEMIQSHLNAQGYLILETELPYIQSVLCAITNAQTSLNYFPHLNAVVPITVFDKEVING